MPIELNCPSCNQLLRVPDDAAGKHARCAQCQAVILVPGDGAAAPSDSSAGGGFGPGDSGTAGGGGPIDGGQGGSGFGALPSQQPAGQSPFAHLPPPKPQPGPPGQASVNPFQSPTTEAYQGMPGYEKAGTDGPVHPQAVDVGAVINKAYEIWSQNLGLLVGVTFVVFVINGGIGAVVGALQESGEDALVILGLAINILSNVLGLFLSIGQAKIMLKLARNQPAEFTDLFAGGPIFLPVLGATLLAVLAMMAGFLLLIIPGIILAILFWPYFWLIVDGKTPALQSFGVALEMGKQNVGTTIVMWLAGFLIAVIGVLACCIGLLFAAPLTGMIFAVGYLAMAGQIKV